MSITVEVRNNNVEQAMRVLKRKLQKEGTLKEYRDKQYYKKPSEKRVERMKERAKVLSKAQKKKDENMGYVFIKGKKGKKKRRI